MKPGPGGGSCFADLPDGLVKFVPYLIAASVTLVIAFRLPRTLAKGCVLCPRNGLDTPGE